MKERVFCPGSPVQVLTISSGACMNTCYTHMGDSLEKGPKP